MTAWKTIDSAPKDGTEVLLWTVWKGDMVCPEPFSQAQMGYWDEGNGEDENDDWFRKPEWCTQNIGEPTHWMELPEGPQ